MLRPYRAILTLPGTLRFSAAGLVARLPMSMLAVGIILMVSETTGTYGLAGAVAAVFALVQALTSPLIARLVDRHGQLRAGAPVAAVNVVSIAGLVLAAVTGAPTWVLFVAAAIAGGTVGSIGSLVRTRWNHVFAAGHGPEGGLRTAYSWEAVLDEAAFVSGPIIVTLLATSVSAWSGVLLSAALVAGGGAWFFAQRATEPPLRPATATTGGRVLAVPAILAVAVSFVFVGGVFGSNDVIAVAITREQGAPGLAGPLLAVFSLGSLVSGIAYGAIQWRLPDGVRLAWSTALLALGTACYLAAGPLWALAILFAATGVSISPTLVSGNTIAQRRAPAGRATEALTWLTTSLGIGVSGGSTLAGHVVDVAGSHAAFLVPAGCGLAALIVVLLGRRALAAPARRDTAVRPAEGQDGQGQDGRESVRTASSSR